MRPSMICSALNPRGATSVVPASLPLSGSPALPPGRAAAAECQHLTPRHIGERDSCAPARCRNPGTALLLSHQSPHGPTVSPEAGEPATAPPPRLALAAVQTGTPDRLHSAACEARRADRCPRFPLQG